MNKIITITGPTSTGKIGYAKYIYDYLKERYDLDCEIVNLDSKKIYKNFQISQHLIWQQDSDNYISHLFGEISPKYEIDLFDFKRIVDRRIGDILLRNNTPILVGGSIIHFRAVVEGWEKNSDARKPLKNSLVVGTKIHKVEFGKDVERHVRDMLERGLYNEFKNVYIKASSEEISFDLVANTIGYSEFLAYAKRKNKDPLKLNRYDIGEIKKTLIKNHFDISYKQEVALKKLEYIEFINNKKQLKIVIDKFISKE